MNLVRIGGRGNWLRIGLLVCCTVTGWAGVTETDFTTESGTAWVCPDGWTSVKITERYSGGGVKLNTTGASLTTAPYSGSVTSVVFAVRIRPSTSASNKGTDIDLSVSAGTASVSGTPAQTFSILSESTSQSLTNLTVAFPESNDIRVVQLKVDQRTKGAVELNSVTAYWVDGSAPLALSVPVINEETALSATGFTASWSAVQGAAAYLFRIASLQVTDASPGTAIFTETFEPSAAYSTTAIKQFDNYTDMPGWSGEKVYPSPGALRIGSTSARGWLLSPSIALPAQSGNYAVSFDAAIYSASEAEDARVQLVTNSGNTTSLIETLSLTTATNTYTIPFEATAGQSVQFCFESGERIKSCRFLLDRVRVLTGYSDGHIATNWIGTESGGEVVGTSTNLTQLSVGTYGYQVKALEQAGTTGALDSVWSTMREVTLQPSVPPVVTAETRQQAWVDESLTIPVTVAKTDADALTGFSAVTEATGVTTWTLVSENASTVTYRVTYTPVAADAGEQQIQVQASDKDGTGTATILVQVYPAGTPSVVLAQAKGTYAQDFNALTNFASSAADRTGWHNLSMPLPAWQAYFGKAPVTEMLTKTNGTATGFYVYPRHPETEDFSIGTCGGSGSSCVFGCVFTNATAETLTELTVSFQAAQWYVGNSNVETLVFQYCVTNRWVSLDEVPAASWQGVEALAFRSTVALLEGESRYHTFAQEAKTGAIPNELPPGELLLIRWVDPDDAGNDHRFAVDDFILSWKGKYPTGTTFLIR
ncbi:MAG: hypothetical protein IJR99_03040 [Kiritimatiellae bacterium]|nr:hypothetical protein [Kiritimatiellia bacterium]